MRGARKWRAQVQLNHPGLGEKSHSETKTADPMSVTACIQAEGDIPKDRKKTTTCGLLA